MKKRVLFLIHTLGVGGAEKVLVNLVNNMDKARYDVTVMTVIDTGIFKYSLNKDIHYKTIFKLPAKEKKAAKKDKPSGSLHSNFGKMKSFLKSSYQFFWRHVNTNYIYKKCIKEKYDYEVAFLEGIATKIIASSTQENSKKYAWIHVDLLNEKKNDQFYRSNAELVNDYNHFDKIVCVSNVVKEQAQKKLGIADDRFMTIYNPIDSNEIATRADEFLVVKSDEITFCTVGRLALQKGYDRLIKVAKKLKNEGFSFQINILGEGPDKNMLESMISEFELNESVHLLGFKSNPYPYMKNCDIFICSSRAEGFSTVASEAVVLGKACLVTNCSGMEELFGENNEYGYIVSNDEKGIYEGMKEFMNNRKLIDFYSQKSQSNRSRFHLEEAINSIQERIFYD